MNLQGLIGPAHAKNTGDRVNHKTIIAPLGYARTGKDEFARVAVEEFGFTRFAFADKLRECLYALNPIVDTDGITPIRVQDVIDQYTWDNYKRSQFGPEIRVLLQRFGTEVGRDLIQDDIWLRELDKVEASRVVVTDARFINELEKVDYMGGYTVRVHRKGVGPVNDHPSETTIDQWDAHETIHNDSTLEVYHDRVRNILRERLNGRVS